MTAIVNFRVRKNVREVQYFLGLAGYYRKFIKNFATVVKLSSELTKADNNFEWSKRCQKAFEKLKKFMVEAPLLRYLDFHKEFTLTNDASNVGLGAILLQEGHPCCYIYRKSKVNI